MTLLEAPASILPPGPALPPLLPLPPLAPSSCRLYQMALPPGSQSGSLLGEGLMLIPPAPDCVSNPRVSITPISGPPRVWHTGSTVGS